MVAGNTTVEMLRAHLQELCDLGAGTAQVKVLTGTAWDTGEVYLVLLPHGQHLPDEVLISDVPF